MLVEPGFQLDSASLIWTTPTEPRILHILLFAAAAMRAIIRNTSWGVVFAAHNQHGSKETGRMKAFGYVSAKDVGHAVALLGEHGAKAKVLAGGTDLLVELKFASHGPEIIVDISRVDELKNITIVDEGLCIGALVTHADIMRSPIILSMFPALADAAHTIGAVQTRNLG